MPGADGKQAGLTYVDQAGESHRTQHLRDYQGCAHPDPDHSYEGGRVELNGGRCDGWLRAGANDDYAIGYYTAADQQFYGRAARYWTSFDRYFSATMAETYPNRFYQHSAQTDRIHNSNAIATMPTIWDRLADAGVSHAYYYYDVPFLALYGTKYLPISRTYPQFLADAAAGTLPAVSLVDPKFLDEGSGTSADDHPHADIRAGQYFVNQVYEAVTSGLLWPRTALGPLRNFFTELLANFDTQEVHLHPATFGQPAGFDPLPTATDRTSYPTRSTPAAVADARLVRHQGPETSS